jgi:hypothetical protein
MGVQARSVHKRIAVYKQGWAIIILKCQRGHDNVHKRIAIYKQGWTLVPVQKHHRPLRHARPRRWESCHNHNSGVPHARRVLGVHSCARHASYHALDAVHTVPATQGLAGDESG